MKRVAIIGGGVAGLAAAYELTRCARADAPLQAVLFEASGRLGGIVETVREGGFIVECGPDAWVTEKPWARELAQELGLGDEVMHSNDAGRKTYILAEKRLVAIPDGMRMMVPSNLDALDSSELFSAGAKQAFHRELARADVLRDEPPATDESGAAVYEAPLAAGTPQYVRFGDWPVYPEVGRRLGVAGEMVFVSPYERGRAFDLGGAIAWWYAAYAKAPPDTLAFERVEQVIRTLRAEGV